MGYRYEAAMMQAEQVYDVTVAIDCWERYGPRYSAGALDCVRQTEGVTILLVGREKCSPQTRRFNAQRGAHGVRHASEQVRWTSAAAHCAQKDSRCAWVNLVKEAPPGVVSAGNTAIDGSLPFRAENTSRLERPAI